MRQKAKEKLKDTDQAGMEKTKTEKLQKAKASLTIKAIPAGAQVKILNTQSRYVHGMELDPGQYNVEVSLTGYETVNLWQPLKQGQDLVLEIVLEKTRAIESSSSIPPLSETTVSSVEKSIIAPVKNETTEKEVSKPSSTMNEQFSNSGQFTKHQNGIVYDSKTGLEWFPGPDVKMNFRKAKVLVSSLSLDGGGWRMPSIYELKALQKDWITSKETAGLLPAASARVWYEDTVPGAYVYYYNFEIGQAYWEYPSYAPDCNAFAVRTRNRR